MSYIEDAVYSFIKNIFTRGIVTLTNKRFLMYSSIAIILPILLTVYTFATGAESTRVYEVLFNIELAACVGFMITGLISFKTQLIKAEHLFFIIITTVLFGLSFINNSSVAFVENIVVYGSFYSWIITTNIAALTAIREFIVSWPGWVIRLGDKNDRIIFDPIIKIGVFASIAWFIYSLWGNFSWSLVLAFMAGAIVIYTIYVFKPITKDAIMTSIISLFYLVLLYHLFVRAESSTGFLIFDIMIIVGTTIFTAQSISNLIASKKHALPLHWDSLIILLLGFMLGYHLLGVKIATVSGLARLYSLYHDIAFGFGTLMIFALLILYASNNKFREFSQSKINTKTVVERVSNAGLDAVNNYANKIKNALKNKDWSFELKKKKDEEEIVFKQKK
ncbi:MAG: hypothetical protein WC307_01550 [Candidatus Nanoarchaeia archaeon]